MHKGYAFVQFASPFDARSACLGEDGRTICSQVIGGQVSARPQACRFQSLFLPDVNMVSEPKPHQGKVKQQQGSKKEAQSE